MTEKNTDNANPYIEDSEEMLDEGIGDTIRLGTLLTLLAVPGIVNAKDIESNLVSSSNKAVSSEVVKNAYSKASIKENYGGFTSIQAANIIAKTLFSEARGEGTRGIDAVASIILNRGNSNPQNYPEVCLKKKQFSCWNNLKDRTPKTYVSKIPASVANNPKEAEILKYCQKVAGDLLTKNFTSTIGSRNVYHTTKVTPSWDYAMSNKTTIGNHVFGYLPEYDNNRKNSSKHASKEEIYVVKRADTLSKIAISNKTTVEKILDLNPSLKKNPNKIRIGMKLKMPA